MSLRESRPAGNRPNHPATAASSWPGRIHRTSTVLSPSMTEGTDGPVGGTIGGRSRTSARFGASGSDGLDQLLIAMLILVGVDTHSSAPSLTWGITLKRVSSAG